MREGWKQVTIGELGQVVTGNTPPRKQPELYGSHRLFIKATDIEVGKKYCFSPEECYSQLGYNKYIKSYIPKDSTCVVTIGSIGQKIIKAHTGLFINQAMNAVIPSELYDKDFVYYLLKLNLFQLKIFDSGTASGRENVSKSTFSRIKVQVPELKETQRRIANILSSYDDLIENNLKRIKLLEEKAQQTYEEWFVRMRFPGHEKAEINKETGLPVGWEKVKLGEVAMINPESIDKGFDGEIEYIDIASVSPGKIDSTTNYNIKEAPGRAKRVVRHGDIIWSCVRPNRKSHSVIWKPTANLIASTGFCVIRPKTKMTSYLLKLLSTEDFVGYLNNRAGGVAYPAIKAIDFKEAEIILPIETVVSEFDCIFSKILEVSWNLQNQNQLLKEARDILLPRLMSGMIEV